MEFYSLTIKRVLHKGEMNYVKQKIFAADREC